MTEFLRRWEYASSGVFRAGIVIAAAAALCVVLAGTATLSAGQALGVFVFLTFAALVAGTEASESRPGAAAGEPAEALSASVLDAVIAGLPDAVVALNKQRLVLAFNAQAGQIAPGLRRGDHGYLAIRIPVLVDAIQRASQSGEPQRVEFSEAVSERWLEAFVIPISSQGVSGTAPDVLLITFHDQTPMRRVEEMRADFVANASHELRTPLAALSGFIDTLQGPARDDVAARERFLKIMQAQATRMARLIDDLLSLSRIELAAHVRPETPHDLVPIVRQAVDQLVALAEV